MLKTKSLKSGFALPALGFGTWLVGGDMKRAEKADTEKSITAIRHAVEAGVTHFDTAEVYAEGEAERVLAQALKPYERSRFCLASKAHAVNHAHDDLLRALENSLARLETDYLDIYYLHAPNLDVPLQETARALNEAHKRGLVKHVAVSNFAAARVDALQAHLNCPIVANQVHLNLVFREPLVAGLLQHAVDRDYFLAAWRPVRFAKRGVEQTFSNAWQRGAYLLLDEVADAYKASNVQVALAWVLSFQNTITLIGTSNPAHVDEAVRALSVQMSDEDIVRLTRDFVPQEAVSDTVPLK